MIFVETKLQGAYVVEPERLRDDRGFFARTFCNDEFQARGLCTQFVQWSVSHNTHKGTLRGMHYQALPHEETKLVRCTRGAIHDVIIDLRGVSPTFGQWTAVELSADNQLALYVPAGFAHGFQTLCDACDVSYHISEFHHPEAARGMRWNDPMFGIDWPLPVTTVSPRDREFPDFKR